MVRTLLHEVYMYLLTNKQNCQLSVEVSLCGMNIVWFDIYSLCRLLSKVLIRTISFSFQNNKTIISPGRDRRVADIPVDHPSCSKQHAALQYRAVKYERDDGSTARQVKPYIIDLGSANGTFLNNQRIEAQRYIELKEKDVLKFGFSSREYVVLNENSQESGGESSPSEGKPD